MVASLDHIQTSLSVNNSEFVINISIFDPCPTSAFLSTTGVMTDMAIGV